MAPWDRAAETPGMEGLAGVLAIVVGFVGLVGGVLWGIATMTGGAGDEPRDR